MERPSLILLVITLGCGCGDSDAPRDASAEASVDARVDGGDAAARDGGEDVLERDVALPDRFDPDTESFGPCPNGRHTPGGPDDADGCWPFEGNTGVPDGPIALYEGPCTINSGNSGDSLVIEGKDASHCGILAIYDTDVTIRNSIVPVIDRTNADGSVDISDSLAHGEGWVGGVLWGSNIIATRVEVVGGQHSVHCESGCTIVDSWLHGQEAPEGEATHNNAFITNGGSDIVLRHNSLFCSPEQNAADGGCTADASVFGDFAPVSNITFDRNLFVATPSGGYCGTFGHNPGKPFGDDPSDIHVTGNVFQQGPEGRCGVFGPATSFLDANGNVFRDNVFDDGSPVSP